MSQNSEGYIISDKIDNRHLDAHLFKSYHSSVSMSKLERLYIKIHSSYQVHIIFPLSQ